MRLLALAFPYRVRRRSGCSSHRLDEAAVCGVDTGIHHTREGGSGPQRALVEAKRQDTRAQAPFRQDPKSLMFLDVLHLLHLTLAQNILQQASTLLSYLDDSISRSDADQSEQNQARRVFQPAA